MVALKRQRRENIGKLRVWYQAARPFSLSAALTPVLVGSALAFREGNFNPFLFVLVIVGSLLVQIAANLIDEYSDHARPGANQKLLAPHKVIALGLLSANTVKRGAMVCLGAAAVIGAYMVYVAGWPILVICLASGAVTYLYSAGPKPLGSLGLGHPLVFLFMGPVMVFGAYYVQTQVFTLQTIWLSLPVGCTVTAILVANDLRDVGEDRATGKMTPVTLFGQAFGRWEWTLLVLTAFALVTALVILRTTSPLALAALLALPQAVKAWRMVWHGRERSELALALRASARLHAYLGILLTAGVALGRFIRL